MLPDRGAGKYLDDVIPQQKEKNDSMIEIESPSSGSRACQMLVPRPDDQIVIPPHPRLDRPPADLKQIMQPNAR